MLPRYKVDSALVQHPCTGPGDCSYNGMCGADGSCECDSAWGGVRCGELQLLPVDRKTAGYVVSCSRRARVCVCEGESGGVEVSSGAESCSCCLSTIRLPGTL